ncbi:hypothetical protein HYC85_011145 [Camellia sinensis]|uniref:AMP-dependent synthetase/ligase domain-containing protein n=1 Tax=Camellia sinensis TaxID=4442 RepID=A0A7J7HLX2_CAMSI|nr:hypothetical protein HYC85_011145 [Camellia sinensis]
MAQKKFVVEIEKAKEAANGRPSMGPVYRNLLAKDGFRPLTPGIDSCWDIFRVSVEKFPKNRMLGQREIVNGKAFNAHGLYCVPLYDSLGAGAVEYIICHAEISLTFVEETKIPEVLKTFPNTIKHLKTLVSFGKVTDEQKKGKNEHFDLPIKKKTDTCTIMYTSGTTGDPKGVVISNKSILSIISAVNHSLESMDQGYSEEDVFLSYLPLAHIFDRVIEELFISIGSSIGFWRGDVKLLIEDIRELKPTILCAVPRVLDRIYSGLTETCAGSFAARPDELAMIGTVGPPLPSLDVCLESVPEMGYDALSSTPRGEICIRGNVLFSGYYKREDLTKEVMIDGWFHTGDIGEWQPDGSMKIIDRKKNIFKLSQGEYVSVENLEGIYSLVSGIDSIWVYGNSFESFLVAVVNPNQQFLECWAEENAVAGDFDTLCENSKAKAYILQELTKIGKEKKLKGFEFIKAVHLDPVPFDMERDLLTPTYKKKRAQFLKYYQFHANRIC